METWQELARECRDSANSLLKSGHHRSSISRAYYAAYSLVTAELAAAGVSMPVQWEGPAHRSLRRLIVQDIARLDPGQRRALSRIVGRLYALRVAADYRPSVEVTERESREAVTLTRKVFSFF